MVLPVELMDWTILFNSVLLLEKLDNICEVELNVIIDTLFLLFSNDLEIKFIEASFTFWSF